MIQSGIQTGEVIGVSYPRSSEAVIAYLAILKCGGTYLPIDPKWPSERLREVIGQSQLTKVISPNSLTFPDHVIKFDLEGQREIPLEDLNPTLVHPQLPAYLLFTSGSTGKPKGILVPHKALLNHFLWTQSNFTLSQDTKMLQMTELTFDVSLSEFHTIFAGGTLHILPEPIKKDPVKFFEYVFKNKITHIQLVPSLLKVLINAKNIYNLTSVHHILCGAEPLLKNDLDLLFQNYKIPISNIYGLTETCIDSVHETFTKTVSSKKIPIGHPIRNTYCYLLDTKGLPAQKYVPAELYIGGDGLATGYLNNPRLTAELFLPDHTRSGVRVFRTKDLCYINSDEKLLFVGRDDQQVKIRGMRVEIAEIELALESHPLVKQVAIVPKSSEQGIVSLHAFYTTKNPVDKIELKKFVTSKLPHYMQPAYYSHLEEMPLTSSGKIDRKRISNITLENSSLEYIPSNKVEKQLQLIWSSILNLSPSNIDTTANFFEIGGSSIGLMQMQTEVNSAFSKEYGIDVFFTETSIKKLAQYIMRKESNDNNKADISWRLKKQQERQSRNERWKRPTV